MGRIIVNKCVFIIYFFCDILKIVVKDIFYLIWVNFKMCFFYYYLDVDECIFNSYDCDVNVKCLNILGLFICECDYNFYYYGNGKMCFVNCKF